ncbi:MAG: hypothetical protein MZV64_48470 [Ignavibacteriales bacterium]|nr:hypothetical protein [Ignavibacteriales bacterium]
MPPFGNLYGMEVFVEEALTADKGAFNAGSHSEIIRLSYEDYSRLVQPKIFRFSWKSTPLPKRSERKMGSGFVTLEVKLHGVSGVPQRF